MNKDKLIKDIDKIKKEQVKKYYDYVNKVASKEINNR